MLRIIPIELIEANMLVSRWHRHHKPAQGHRFSLGVITEAGELCGAAICGRPVARLLDQRATLEVTRLVTDGTRNACSILYGACARTAKVMGYTRIQTYILDIEVGTSLRAAGWVCEAKNIGGGSWAISRPDRRTDQPIGRKQRWIKELNPAIVRPIITDDKITPREMPLFEAMFTLDKPPKV